MLQWLDNACGFPVEHVGGIPHFPDSVSPTAPRSAVLHTTEGPTLEGALSVFKTHYAPHFLLGKDAAGKVRILQLVPVGFIGAALVTHNNLALVQVEMVGFSKETIWLPDDGTAQAISALMAACRNEYQIPLSHPWPDGVYGKATASDPHRNAGQFGRIAGWFGHGDVPSPDSHWDPGAIEWSKLFSIAGTIPTALPTQPAALPSRPCACSPPIVDKATTMALFDAVEAFQKAAGLPIDADPGPATRAAFLKALGK